MLQMQLFGPGPRLDDPVGDSARQAVASLRGYAYQLYASGLAWLALPDGATLHLEVAEDYAVATREAMTGTQVRDTEASGGLTLQSEWVRDAIESYVDLVTRNPSREVSFHYLTTSPIGLERRTSQRIGNRPALEYWRRAAAGAELAPLRKLIEALDLAEPVAAHIKSFSDEAFRTDFLQRMHWQCGAPGLADVRRDLEAGVIEYAASARRLSSQTAVSLTPAILEKVLLTTVTEGARTLRRADLLKLIDAAAMVAVPIDQLSAAFQARPDEVRSRTTLLVPAGEVSIPALHAARAGLVASIDAARRVGGLAVVFGGTGLGKSLAARLVAAGDPALWSVADFRDLAPAETASRLARLHGELAASPVTHLILDDLNGMDDPAVRDALARLLATLRRRDATAVVTTYRTPAVTTLQSVAPDIADVVEVGYFTSEEVADLVTQAGGDRKYADAIRRAAASGHPQLTMAIVLNLRAADWSRGTLAKVLGGNLEAELGSERRAARERIVGQLTDEAYALLLRTSLIRGSFDRALAIKLAYLDPAVPRGGVALDRLVGPWIEPFRRGRLRISPLIQNAADEMLSAEECRAVHRCVAEATMLRPDGLEPADASVAMHHALRSGETGLVVGFAQSVVTCGPDMTDALAPYLTELMFLRLDRPIFPQDGAASAMMRLAQLLALLPYGTAEQARACWTTLEAERLEMHGATLFEGLCLSKLLLHPRTGELFDDWFETILRFDRLCLADPQLGEANSSFHSRAGGKPHITGVLFAGQIRSIATVAGFRAILERLSREDSDTRERVLSSFRPGRGDISVLVNHGWLRESRTDAFDWEVAQREYAACFDLATGWGNTMLASRCAIAQAICIDENGGDPDRALDVLTEAELCIGESIALGRARAKILWRRMDHAAALPLLVAAAEAGGQDRIEQAYIARDAGISAAALGEWDAARGWFDRAQHAAAKTSAIPSVGAMAIGLLADTAHAAFKAGRPDIAIEKMRDALMALPSIDPNGTIQEAYCHRVVRHGLLWLYREITGLELDGEETFYRPGAASNPEPPEAIRSHPLVALDMSFYLLAEADEALAAPTGYHRDFRKDLVEGPVLSSELSAAIKEDHKAIGSHDPSDFAARVRRHASMALMVGSGEARSAAERVTDPIRGTIPLATIDDAAQRDLRGAAEDYLLSFATAAAIARAFGSIDSIVAQGLAEPSLAALHPLLRRMGGEVSEIASDRDGAANAIWLVREDLSGRPAEFVWAGIWLVVHVSNSRLRDGVAQALIALIFAGADYLIRNTRFSLVTPAQTVPPVERLISAPQRDMASAARLLLTLAQAVGTRLPDIVRTRLEDINKAG